MQTNRNYQVTRHFSCIQDMKRAMSDCKTDHDRLSVAERIPYIWWEYISDLEDDCTNATIKRQLHNLAIRGYRLEESLCEC